MKNISVRMLSILLTIAYGLTLLPMLLLALYSYPAADDFGMGREVHFVYEQTGSLIAAIGKAFSTAVYYYYNWIGYYTSSFFAAIPPSSISERLYPLGAIFVLVMLHAGVAYLLHVLLTRWLGIGKDAVRCITVVTLFLMIQCMPAGAPRMEAFYWYSGSSNYTLMFAIPLLFLGCYAAYGLEREKPARRRILYVCSLLLAFVSGGANYMTALCVAIVMAMVILWNLYVILRKRDAAARRFLSCEPAVVNLAGFLISITAPGNQVRAQGEVGSIPAAKAVLISLHYTLSYCVDQWTGWAVICLLVLLIPVWMQAADVLTAENVVSIDGILDDMAQIKGNDTVPFVPTGVKRVGADEFLKLCRKLPTWMILLLGFGLISANVTPPLYATGNIDAGRIQSLFWMQYVLILVLLEGFLILRCRRVWREAGIVRRMSGVSAGELMETDVRKPMDDTTCEPAGEATDAVIPVADEGFGTTGSRVIRMVLAFFVLAAVMTVIPQEDYFTSSEAVREIVSGEAQAFRDESIAREAILKDPGISEAALPAYQTKPPLLYFGDVEEDPGDWVNFTLQQFYHKQSVTRENDSGSS